MWIARTAVLRDTLSMRHAGPDVLARIAPLLAQLRARGVLHERRPGVFELRSRAFLHFHDDPAGIFADVRLAEAFVRLRVSTPDEQAELLDRIDSCLEAAASRDTNRRRQENRRRRRNSSGEAAS
jgi:hypothetical protein